MQEPWNVPTLLADALTLTEGSQTDKEIVEAARKLVRLESAVRAALSRAVAVMISQGAHESSGHATAADLLRSEFHLSGREANELALSAVRLREQLHCTFVALQSGVIKLGACDDTRPRHRPTGHRHGPRRRARLD